MAVDIIARAMSGSSGSNLIEKTTGILKGDGNGKAVAAQQLLADELVISELQIDSQVQQGSNNLITSGAVYDYVEENQGSSSGGVLIGGLSSNWRQFSLPQTASYGQPIYGNGIWVSCSINSVIWSEDGTNWNESISSQTGIEFSHLSFNGNEWILTHGGFFAMSSVIYRSTDGKNWSEQQIGAEVKILEKPFYSNGKWIILIQTTNGYGVIVSDDGGITWSVIYIENLRTASIFYINNKFILKSSFTLVKSIWISDDAEEWEEISFEEYPCSIISYNNLLLVSTLSMVYWSDDLITWEQSTMPEDFPSNYNGQLYCNDSICILVHGVLSPLQDILWSEDGKAWNLSSLPVLQKWGQTALYNNGTWVITPYSSEQSQVAAWSTDGKTWTSSSLPVNQKWGKLTYGNNTWVLTPYVGLYFTDIAWSFDGKTWRNSQTPVSGVWVNPVYSNNMWIVFSNSNSDIGLYNVGDIYQNDQSISSNVSYILKLDTDYATKQYVDNEISQIPSPLPEVTSEDNGKVLKVVDGEWDKGEAGGEDVPIIYLNVSNKPYKDNGLSEAMTAEELYEALIKGGVFCNTYGEKYGCTGFTYVAGSGTSAKYGVYSGNDGWDDITVYVNQ